MPENKYKTYFIITLISLIFIFFVGGGITGMILLESYRARTTFENRLSDLKSQNQALSKQLLELRQEQAERSQKTTCVDSDVNEKPDDIYIKGNVVYTDKNGDKITVDDECTGSKTQVNEMWCYESPTGSGNYVQGNLVNNCPKGCLDGACYK